MMQLSLHRKSLTGILIFSLLLFIVTPVFFPNWRGSLFIPLFIVSCYQKKLPVCLLVACFCGLLCDLISPHTHLGLYPLCYCITLCIVYKQRYHFFSDSITTLPILTLYFSFVSSFILSFLLYYIEGRTLFSWVWIWTDLIVLPLLDASYAFCLFTIPSLFKRRAYR